MKEREPFDGRGLIGALLFTAIFWGVAFGVIWYSL